MNALKPEAAAASLPTAVAERAAGLSLNVHTSLGALVPVSEAPIPGVAYEQACNLATAVGANAAKLKYTVGPEAEVRGFDVWVAKDDFGPALLKVGSGIAGAIALLAGACMYGLDGVTAGAYVATGGAAALALCGWASTAGGRNERQLDKARGRRVESSQLDKIFAPFQQASADVRAIASRAVRAELAPIDSTLSAKAVETRDRVLSAQGDSPEAMRAARVTEALAALLRRGEGLSTARRSVDTIIACLTEATPPERREMAGAIERCAFASEQPRFQIDSALEYERSLYRGLRAAANGDAPAR